MKAKNIISIALATALILLVPLVAMRFTDKVDWDEVDFIVMGALILGTGLALDVVMRKMGNYKVVTALAVVTVFLYVWAELAVGIFTNWGS